MTSYISCACNRVPHSIDWGNNGLICYGACNAIAIYDPYAGKIGKVLQTFHRHKDRVNTVRWISRGSTEPETELLSCSVDGTTIIWSKINDSFEPTTILDSGQIVTIANSLYITTTDTLVICTGSIDGNLRLWLKLKNEEANHLQTITFGRKLPIESCLLHLPINKVPLLAVALEDSTIHLFCQKVTDSGKSVFTKVQILSGHEDWIRCMDFRHDTNGDVLLATGSQDTTIRLWRISVNAENSAEKEIQQKERVFILDNVKYNIILESVLSGHEGWVYGVHWQPLRKENDGSTSCMKLLSCSLDKSMIIWEPDKSTGIWTETVRVGEVGGNSLGFYGCKFDLSGQSILAHGYQGSFHIWTLSNTSNHWLPRSVPSGHFSEVVDLCWDPKGRFLITASTDQTTRIHAPWKNESEELWHEIGRPQVHGYNIACLAMLNSYMFASGAEEKVVRIFTASETFKNYLNKIANVDDFDHVTADSAAVSALGLTNKALFNVKQKVEKSDLHYSVNDYIPPTEEELVRNTLWPELQKLYGHGYEIFSMAARHDGSLLATACRSTSIEHSAIILWDTKTWTRTQKLLYHQLTVTQLSFAPNDKYLLAVSRDRNWSLFQFNGINYTLVTGSSKKNSFHSRIIWCCTWTHDSLFFATGSRDGKIGVWHTDTISENIIPTTSLDKKGQSITALNFATINIEYHYILAIGYDTGHIEIQKLTRKGKDYIWNTYLMYDSSQAHHLTVKKLKFRPYKEHEHNTLQLASCGSDHAVKIYKLSLLELLHL